MKTKSPSSDAIAFVRAHLKAYADQGVFRSFRELPTKNGRASFSFVWLSDRPFVVVVDPARGTIQLKDLLPGLPARSANAKEIRAFVLARMDPELREHRRIDSNRASIVSPIRNDTMSITMQIRDGDYEYGIRKMLNFVNELFGYLQLYQVEYVTNQLGFPEE